MRLEKIKLSGFKSFVDPTTVQLPSNLVGIVGPNGCGKSNVIDAVRWVMGESSAKTLRGESMTDVIFNGSSARKPIGQASIELFFDNSDGTIGGEYAGYSEISIRRTVNRDAQSTYFLNGVRCRRRDIKDVFLGTGLGPRSYSIIEQGMISRFIEAKPDDLRVFIEEAAGISKYKERRRETENRISHTRENLARVTDLRDELDKQLNHLHRQAQAAEKFKEYKTQERLMKAQLQAIRYHQLESDSSASQTALRDLETAQAEKQAKYQRIQTDLEQHREYHIDASDKHSEAQKRYYGLGHEVTRLEQSIAHEKEKRQQLTEDYEQAELRFTETEENLAQDNDQIEALNVEIERLEPQLSEAKAALESSQQQLSEAEECVREGQSTWDAFNQQFHKDTQTAEVTQTQIQHLEKQIADARARMMRIDEEFSKLDSTALLEEVNTLTTRLEIAENTKQQHDETLRSLINRLQTQRQSNQEQADRCDESKQVLQNLQAKRTSLETLQKAALGQSDESVSDWLIERQLHTAPRLAEQLKVDAGWEKAVETVLDDYLEAVCVNDVNDIAHSLSSLSDANVTFFLNNSVQSAAHSDRLLLNKIHSQHNLHALLSGVYFAENLSEALALRSTLQVGESVVTREGLWLSQSWLRVSHKTSERSGVIERTETLKQLEKDIEAARLQTERSLQALEEGKTNLADLETQRDSQQQKCNEAAADVADVRAILKVKQARKEQIERRTSQLNQEKQEQNDSLDNAKTELHSCRERWNTAMAAMQDHASRKEVLLQEREAQQLALREARQATQEARETVHSVELRYQTNKSQLDTLVLGVRRLESQLSHLDSRRSQLKEALDNDNNPIAELQANLEENLQQHLSAEEALTQAKQHLQNIEAQMREWEVARDEIMQSIDEDRSELERLRIDMQAMVVRKQTIIEQLAETELTLEEVDKDLPEDASAPIWEEELEKIAKRIQRLGAINLAAIEEFDAQSERKVYLDAQLADLEEALQTLETAINKIDKETQARFKETYDAINNAFKELFPQVFGGGAAYLELTGEDLLTTGITVMAQPPGKRNSTIHLLSGGEKALTAIALVFSIFQLNPSPFCILDEVDAPLDDANVGRFCKLVESMSETVQFIYISHNKLAIAMAKQLVGVTMHEPGVSRLVAVDVEEAVAMAEAD